MVGSFVLADSPANIPLTNLRINGDRVIQEEALFGAAAKAFFDRGNRRTVVTFDTTRRFDTQLDAETFLLMHETQFPGQGLVTFQSGSTGQKFYRAYLVNAVVNRVGSGISGCTTRHSYRITGGAMSATPA